MAEEKRVSKNANNKDHKWDNPDPINWNTVDLNALALDVMYYARMGLDMMQDNHLSAIPFKDNNRQAKTGTKIYTVNLMPGYNGIQYIAGKYAQDKPLSVTVELVYSTDTFKPVKKIVKTASKAMILKSIMHLIAGKSLEDSATLSMRNRPRTS
jgi:recombination protein RecT